MLCRSLVKFAALGAFALSLAGCSALTRSDEITISAEVFGAPPPAPAAAPQPIQIQPGVLPKTGG